MSPGITVQNAASRRANLHADGIEDRGGMNDGEADKAAILAVMKAETDAWLRRDFAAQAQHWVHSPQTRLMTAFASLGTRVDEGWDAIGARLERQMARFTKRYDMAERVRLERVNVVVCGDMAWVSYDQIGSDTGDDFEMAGVHARAQDLPADRRHLEDRLPGADAGHGRARDLPADRGRRGRHKFFG